MGGRRKEGHTLHMASRKCARFESNKSKCRLPPRRSSVAAWLTTSRAGPVAGLPANMLSVHCCLISPAVKQQRTSGVAESSAIISFHLQLIGASPHVSRHVSSETSFMCIALLGSFHCLSVRPNGLVSAIPPSKSSSSERPPVMSQVSSVPIVTVSLIHSVSFLTCSSSLTSESHRPFSCQLELLFQCRGVHRCSPSCPERRVCSQLKVCRSKKIPANCGLLSMVSAIVLRLLSLLSKSSMCWCLRSSVFGGPTSRQPLHPSGTDLLCHSLCHVNMSPFLVESVLMGCLDEVVIVVRPGCWGRDRSHRHPSASMAYQGA